MKYAYYGHHKCASTWIREIVEQVLREAGYTYDLILDPKTPHKHGKLTNYRDTFPREQLAHDFPRSEIDFLSCITADVEQAKAVNANRAFHVIRDPRDIIVSGYFSHRNSHPVDGLPHLAKHRDNLLAVSEEEGLFLEMDFSIQCLRDIGSWDYNQATVLEVKMEDLTASPYEGFLDIFEFLGMMSWEGVYKMQDKTSHFVRTALNRLSLRSPILNSLRRPILVTGEMLLGRVYDNRFEKKTSGRKVGQTDTQSHYRKGKAGDWSNHFTRAHAEYFNEQFEDLLLITGYESSAHWIDTVAPCLPTPEMTSPSTQVGAL